MTLTKLNKHISISTEASDWKGANLEYKLRDLQRGKLYAFAIYDLDAPDGIYLHYLAVNLTSSNHPYDTRKIATCDFKPLNPPSGVHRYVFELLEQENELRTEKVVELSHCDSSRILSPEDMEDLLESLGSSLGQLEIDVYNSDLPSGMLGTSKEAKYCHCIVEVESEKDRKQSSKIRNPYAICASSVGTTTGRSPCSQYYDFNKMENKYLEAYLKLHKINPNGLSRDEMLSRIENKLKEE